MSRSERLVGRRQVEAFEFRELQPCLFLYLLFQDEIAGPSGRVKERGAGRADEDETVVDEKLSKQILTQARWGGGERST